MESCLVEGHRIAYQRSGQGPPVLLVHGITTNSFLWREVAPRLARRFEVVAVDLLGCGESDKPAAVSLSLKDHARRLSTLVGALGLAPVHFVGHDLGGGIGQIAAVRWPALLRSLTLVNCVAYDYWPVQPILSLRTPVIRQLLMGALDAGALRLVVRRGLFHKEKTAALMEDFSRPLRTPEGRRALVQFARSLDNTNLMELAEELRLLRMPVTVFWGTADAYLSAAIPGRLAAEIPGCRVRRIETAGHFVPLDEPELLAAGLEEVLSGAGAA